MDNKDKDFGFDFYIGDVNKNSNDEFEDVFSSSSGASDSVSLSSFAGSGGKKNYNKKGHNFWVLLKSWWRRRKSWQKASMITAVSVLLVFTIVYSIFMSMFDYNYNEITEDHEELGVENVIDKDIVNVALFGIDTRNLNSFKGNSDSIMILSLNTTTKKVKIISVMRDTFVPIAYNGITTYNKINSAYSKGGPELAIKTLNTNFGLDITEYATVNFYGMVDIIDAVGGIEAELTTAEIASATKNLYAVNACIKEICEGLGKNPNEHYITKSGVQHLNGIQAVAYSRIRYVANIWGTNNDYGRTDRQRYVMEQLFNKALTLEKSQYIKLAKSLIPCSETSLSYSEIIGLAFDILLKSPTFSQARMPQQEFLMTQPNTSAGSVVYYDLEFAKTLIHSFIYDDITFEDYIAVNGIQKNDWYKGGNRRPSSNSTSSSSSTVVPDKDESSVNESSGTIDDEDESKPTESDEEGTSKPTESDDGTSGKPEGSDEDDTSTKPEKPDDDESEETSGSSSESGDDTSSDEHEESKPADNSSEDGNDSQPV